MFYNYGGQNTGHRERRGEYHQRDAYFSEPQKIQENLSDQDKSDMQQSWKEAARTATRRPRGTGMWVSPVHGPHSRGPLWLATWRPFAYMSPPPLPTKKNPKGFLHNFPAAASEGGNQPEIKRSSESDASKICASLSIFKPYGEDDRKCYSIIRP